MTKIKHQGRTLKIAHNVIIFFLIFGTTLSAFSQTTKKVIAARDKIAAINAGTNDDIVSGQKYILKRKTDSGVIIVGIVRVEKTLPDKSGIRLIEDRNSSFIQKYDYLGNEIKDKQDEPSKNNNEIVTESKKEPSEEQRLKNQLALSGYWSYAK